MIRKISDRYPAIIEKIDTTGIADVRSWLREMAGQYKLNWLLAHADDGVIWGENRADALVTSHEAAPDTSPPLRTATLQQARLFSISGELLLWRDDDGDWKASLIREARSNERPDYEESIDEWRILWGTEACPAVNGFSRLNDGGQGLRHAVPIEIAGVFNESGRPLRLQVRHYVTEDELGFARIAASRLVNLRQK